jgi:ribosomal protein S17
MTTFLSIQTAMKKTTCRGLLNGAAKMLVLTALLAMTSCSSTPPPSNLPEPFSKSASNNGSVLGGEIVTDAISTTATVVSVDRSKRLVVLKRADGSTVTYKAAPNAIGFEDVKAGDLVKISVADERAMFLGKNSIPANAGADIARLRVRLPGGTQAVATEVGVLNFTAKITAINVWNESVTLQLADGSTKTISVSDAVNLADVSVGDTVSVQSTEAAVLVLEKP